MAKGYLLSENDRKVLKELIDRERHSIKRPLKDYSVGQEQPTAPEVYVALVPSGGIPRRSPTNDPGSAECDIYRLTLGSPSLISAGFTRTVYNLSLEAITEGLYVLTARDKFGNWYVTTVGGEEDITGTSGVEDMCDLSALTTGDCVLAVSTYLNQRLTLEWNGERWTSEFIATGTAAGTATSTSGDTNFTYPGGSGVLEFWYANGNTHLSLDGIELLNCGDGCFSGGPLTGHDDTAGTAGGCTGETFRICVACVTCPEEDATGTGTGTGNGEPSAPCQSINFGAAFPDGAFTNKTGDCTCLPDTPTVVGSGIDEANINTIGCPANVQLDLACSGGQYVLTSATEGIIATLVSFTADPFVLVFDVTGYGTNCGDSGGGARLTITWP